MIDRLKHSWYGSAMKSQIITLPHEVLRQSTQKIRTFDDSLRTLIADMRDLMHAAEGVGLAAPQMGLALRLAVIEYDPARFKEETDFSIPFLGLANPKIIHRSTTTETMDEGCLSIPGATMPVERATEVTVLAQNEHGERIRIRAKGFLARILQHEIDHLSGMMIIDRTRNHAIQIKYQDLLRR